MRSRKPLGRGSYRSTEERKTGFLDLAAANIILGQLRPARSADTHTRYTSRPGQVVRMARILELARNPREASAPTGHPSKEGLLSTPLPPLGIPLLPLLLLSQQVRKGREKERRTARGRLRKIRSYKCISSPSTPRLSPNCFPFTLERHIFRQFKPPLLLSFCFPLSPFRDDDERVEVMTSSPKRGREGPFAGNATPGNGMDAEYSLETWLFHMLSPES